MNDPFSSGARPDSSGDQPATSPGARSLIAPLAGLAAAAGALFAAEDDAEAGRRQRIRARRERQDDRDDRRDDRRDDNHRDGDGDGHGSGRHAGNDDDWGGSTEGGSPVSRTPGSHIRNDFDAWS